MNWLQLVGSLAAVFVVAALVWWMGMGKAPRIESAEQAERLAREAHSGFRPVDTIVDRNGQAALVRGESGEIVLLRAHGAQIAARVFRDPPQAQFEAGRLIIETGEAMFGRVILSADEGEAAPWLPSPKAAARA